MATSAQLTQRHFAVTLVMSLSMAGVHAPGLPLGNTPATSTATRLLPGAGEFEPPTDAAVVTPFDMADGPYGAGNFGIDYATEPGDSVLAIGAGTVAFAGNVAGQFWVTIDHGDGYVSSYGPMASSSLVPGLAIGRSMVVGTVLGPLHLGVRLFGEYIDPASLWTRRVGHAQLDGAYRGFDEG